VHPQNHASFLIDRIFIIRDACAIRRAHFAKHRATLLHDFRNAKTVANFDHSPRETITSPPRANAASVASTAAAQLFTTIAASAPVNCSISRELCTSRFPRAPAANVVFKIGILRRQFAETLQNGSRQRRSPQVRVQDHAGGIDHSAQRWCKHLLDTPHDTQLHRFHCKVAFFQRFARNNVPPRLGQNTANHLHQKSAFQLPAQVRHSRSQQQFVHRRQLPKAAPSDPQVLLFLACRHWSTAGNRPQFQLFEWPSRCSRAVVSCASPRPSGVDAAKTASRMTLGDFHLMATIDEDLSALERDIRQLKIEYDMYSVGGRKRPPN